MSRFKGTFVHVIEQVYAFEVEADSKEEAKELLEDDPFAYISKIEPIDEQGLDIKEVEFTDD